MTPAEVLELAPELFAAGAQAEALGARVAAQMRAWSPAMLYWLEGRVGRNGPYRFDLIPAHVPALSRRPQAVAALCIASVDGDGFVREAAVRALAGESDALAFRFLVLRVRDWVTVVRELARDALSVFPASRWAEEARFTRALVGRGLRDIGELVDDRLGTPEGRAALVRVVEAGEPAAAAAALDELLRLHSEAATELVGGLPLARGAALGLSFVSALERLPSDVVAAVALRSVTARSLPLRRLAWRELARLGEFPGEELVRTALFDRSAEIRGLARWFVRTRHLGGLSGALQLYRQRFDAGGAHVGVALAGLAEVGDQDDRERFCWAAASPRPAWRRLGLSGLARVAPDEARQVLRVALGDPAPSVLRHAAALIAARGLDAEDRATAEAVVLAPATSPEVRSVLLAWLQRVLALADALGLVARAYPDASAAGWTGELDVLLGRLMHGAGRRGVREDHVVGYTALAAVLPARHRWRPEIELALRVALRK